MKSVVTVQRERPQASLPRVPPSGTDNRPRWKSMVAALVFAIGAPQPSLAAVGWKEMTTDGALYVYLPIRQLSSMAIGTDNVPQLAYIDAGDGGSDSDRGNVTTVSDGTWAGPSTVSPVPIQYPSLALDSTNTPYVASREVSPFFWVSLNGAYLRKWNASNYSWDIVGGAPFGDSNSWYISLAFDSADTPYVGYAAWGNWGIATVKKFNGTSWVQVGGDVSPGLSCPMGAGTCTSIPVKFDSNDTPYVAYADYSTGHNGEASVKKFDGTSWVPVGTERFSAGEAQYLALAVDKSTNTPYVAFADMANGNMTVMKFNGSAWVSVGTPGFDAGSGVAASSIALSLTTAGVPFVSFIDDASAVHVMKFNGTSWQTVGGAPITTAGGRTQLGMVSGNVPVVAFLDPYSVRIAQYTTYSLTYAANGATSGTAPTSSTLEANATATAANNTGALVKTGFTFAGWNTAADGSGTSYATGGSFTLTANTTLYAEWLPPYTLSFNTLGGSTVGNITVTYGSSVSAPAQPTRTGYSFNGWHTDASANSPYAFGQYTTKGDLTLYAHWQANQYALTFDTNGGSAVPVQTVTYGATATAPVAPTKSGYTFAGWYTDAGLTTAFDFGSPISITADATLYAKWTPGTGTGGGSGSGSGSGGGGAISLAWLTILALSLAGRRERKA